jgi:hypothetical protein
LSKANLFFKVEVEHDANEKPEKIGEEIVRQIKRAYGVIEAELSHFSVIGVRGPTVCAYMRRK